MRKIIATLSILASSALALTGAGASPVVVIEPVVADGDMPFCSAGDKLPAADGCTQPEAEFAAGRWARRHTHVGIPWVGEVAPVHGWGVPPGVFTVEVPEGASDARLEAVVEFGWDQSVPGGAGNDVELHLWADETRLDLIASTVGQEGNVPFTSSHTLTVDLAPGLYYLQEDVAFGEHTWWLTNATLTYTLAG